MNDEEFRIEMAELFRSVTSAMTCTMKEFYEPFGLTGVQALILGELLQRGPTKISVLAKELSMTNSNLSVICKRLEKNGFLTRRRDESDQRVVYVTLTDKSKEILEKIDPRKCHPIDALQRACEDDKRTIILGLRKLNELLTADLDVQRCVKEITERGIKE